MRWAPQYSPHWLLLALGTLVLSLVLMLAAAPELGTLDFSIGGAGPETSAPASGGTLSATPQVGAPPEPAWATEPLAAPLDGLLGRR